jgi:hypothetical protein
VSSSTRAHPGERHQRSLSCTAGIASSLPMTVRA